MSARRVPRLRRLALGVATACLAGATAGLDAPKSSPTKGRGSATSGLAVGIALGGADSGPEITKLWPHWAHFPRLPASSGLNAYWRPHSGHRKDIAIALTS